MQAHPLLRAHRLLDAALGAQLASGYVRMRKHVRREYQIIDIYTSVSVLEYYACHVEQ